MFHECIQFSSNHKSVLLLSYIYTIRFYDFVTYFSKNRSIGIGLEKWKPW